MPNSNKHSYRVNISVIAACLLGGPIFSPAIAVRLIAHFAQPRPAVPNVLFPELSSREQEILDLLARGDRSNAIADYLGLSSKTISNYISNILNKLQVTDRAQAIAMAREGGLGQGSE